MSETKIAEVRSKKTAEVTDPGEEYVDYFVFKDARIRGDDSILVSVNGDEIRVKPGNKVKIKRKFAEVLDNMAKSDSEALLYTEQNAL